MSRLFHYTLHRRLLASDCELSGVQPAEAGDADLTLRLRTRATAPSATPWYRTETTHADDAIVIDRTVDGALVMRFADATSFLIDARGSMIELLTTPPHYTDADLAAYALGPVLAVALHARGAVLLHAASVVMRDKAVLFAGTSGAGKSTTAAILHRHGYEVLSDDLTEIDDALHALPSLAAIRLWPDIVEALHGSVDAFPDRAPSWDKKLVRVNAASEARPLAAILFLDARADAARLQRLEPRGGWQRLIANVFTAKLPDPEMTRKMFDVTSALVDRVPLFAFSAPPITDADELPEFLDHELAEWLR
ncbi:MAG TPA: hypothetical protein VEK79_08330 [Thermoanaerobaculia bacterium]|nr:hypothetical protein [Thermoanaerobaculia bacterium]